MNPPLDPNTQQFNADILDIVLKGSNATRAAILLLDRDGKEFVTATYRDPQRTVPAFPIDRTITDRVLASGVPVTSEDVTIHCVPMVAGSTIIGVIYAENPDEEEGLDTEGMWIVLLVSGIMATILGRIRYIEWLETENRRLKEEIRIQHDMVGDSPRMREVIHFVERMSKVDSTVLIMGESGTGKELVAQAIHGNSSRRDGPFIAFNCGGVAATLIESELFGHEKGAFSGAHAQRKGYFEAAHGGTLFLDEIGELPTAAQAVLLRVLQEKEFQRVGGTRPIKVDVRIIAATNRNLEEAVAEGRFRKDLFYRINVVSIVLPTLAERAEDIPMLALHFIQKKSRLNNVPGLSEEALRLMMAYHWPGNVRELQNAIERALGISASGWIRPEDLPKAVAEADLADDEELMSFHYLVDHFKRAVIIDALAKTDRKVAAAAKRLKLSEKYTYRLIGKYGIEL